MDCPTCKTPMQLFAGNRERHWVCPKCNTWEERTPPPLSEEERRGRYPLTPYEQLK